MIKAVDSAKNVSTVEATADLLYLNQLNVIAESNEAPAWSGTNSGYVVHWTGVIFPDSLDDADEDTWDTFDIFVPNPVPTCTYESHEVDGVTNSPQRVWADVEARLGPMETTGVPDPTVEIKIKPDGGAYGAYVQWAIGTISARYATMKITTDTSRGIPVISAFDVIVDAEERSEGEANVTVSASGLVVTFAQQFKTLPRINTTAQAATSLNATYTGASVTGFTLHIFNSVTGSEVGGTATWSADGV